MDTTTSTTTPSLTHDAYILDAEGRRPALTRYLQSRRTRHGNSEIDALVDRAIDRVWDAHLVGLVETANPTPERKRRGYVLRPGEDLGPLLMASAKGELANHIHHAVEYQRPYLRALKVLTPRAHKPADLATLRLDVQRAVQSLPRPQAIAAWRVWAEGTDAAEVYRDLGITPGAGRRLLDDAKKALRRDLAPYESHVRHQEGPRWRWKENELFSARVAAALAGAPTPAGPMI